MPGFGPTAKALLLRQKDPKPMTPSSTPFDWADAGNGRADQLTEPVLSLVEGLKQGPPTFEERPPIGPNSRRRFEGKGDKETSQSAFDFTHLYPHITIRCNMARLTLGPLYLGHRDFGAATAVSFNRPCTERQNSQQKICSPFSKKPFSMN